MNTSKRGYLMAMVAGVVIIGAATAGVTAAATSGEDSATPAATPGLSASSAVVTDAEIAEAFAAGPESMSDSVSEASSTTEPAASPTMSTPADSGPAETVPAPAAPSVGVAAPAAVPIAKFKDGQYTAQGSYPSPGGTETLGVTVTLAADVVTSSSLELLGGAGISRSYQTLFAKGYLEQVVGKDISTISLGAIGGSSLTAMGFNTALALIETQAGV